MSAGAARQRGNLRHARRRSYGSAVVPCGGKAVLKKILPANSLDCLAWLRHSVSGHPRPAAKPISGGPPSHEQAGNSEFASSIKKQEQKRRGTGRITCFSESGIAADQCLARRSCGILPVINRRTPRRLFACRVSKIRQSSEKTSCSSAPHGRRGKGFSRARNPQGEPGEVGAEGLLLHAAAFV